MLTWQHLRSCQSRDDFIWHSSNQGQWMGEHILVKHLMTPLESLCTIHGRFCQIVLQTIFWSCRWLPNGRTSGIYMRQVNQPWHLLSLLWKLNLWAIVSDLEYNRRKLNAYLWFCYIVLIWMVWFVIAVTHFLLYKVSNMLQVIWSLVFFVLFRRWLWSCRGICAQLSWCAWYSQATWQYQCKWEVRFHFLLI